MLTHNDRLLIEEAYNTPCWKWADVLLLIEDADAEETKKRLKNVADMLWDYNQEGWFDESEATKPRKRWWSFLKKLRRNNDPT